MSEAYGFFENDARRILQKSRAGNEEPQLPLPPIQPTSGACMAQVKTGGISARSGTTAGSGDATILQIATGSALSTTSFEVTVYNLGTGTAAVNDYITIVQEHVTGKWFWTAVT